jgi:hypothetical protein
MPIYATLAELAALTGVPRKAIRRLAGAGRVASVKLGRSRQADRVYRVADLVGLLDGAAAGAGMLETGGAGSVRAESGRGKGQGR